MFFQSTLAMTVIDLLVVGICVVMLVILRRTRFAVPRQRGVSGPLLIVLGVLVTGLFYVADLVTMHALPSLIGSAAALQSRETLHLSVRWPVTLGSLLLIAFGFVCDSRERTAAEELLRNSQKLEAVGRLAGGLAHDFNNALTVIIGTSDFAMSRLDEDHPVHRDLDQIRAAAERSAVLTGDLLSFARQQTLRPRTFDLNELVERVSPMLERTIGDNIILETALEDDLGMINADAGKLEHVILNLVLNAVESIPNTGRVVIQTSNYRPRPGAPSPHPDLTKGDYVTISVADDGAGMDEETQARIFDPFFTTKEREGSGLGLSMVHGIVTQSGGMVSVTSAPGEGTTFRLFLKRADQPAEDLHEAPRLSAGAGSGSGKILVVEDEDPVRDVAVRALREAGYEVVQAGSPLLALSRFRANPTDLDLILTDVIMPQMSGSELVASVREMRPELPIVFMSGFPREELARKGMLPRDVPLLDKPFAGPQLLAVVRETIGLRESVKANLSPSL